MFKLAIKSVRHNPKRLLLTAAAVALGVMLLATTQTLTAGLSSGFSGLFSDIYGGADVIVEEQPSDDDNAQDFTSGDMAFQADDVTAVAGVDGVADAAGGVQVDSAAILAVDADLTDPLAQFGPPTQLFNWTGEPAFDRATLEEGSAPSADDEVVMDFESAANLGYAIGDTVPVLSATGATNFTLVGTVRFGDDNNLQGATLAYITEDAAHTMVGEDGYQTIAVKLADGANADAVVDGINQVLPDGTRAITGEDKAAEQAAEFDSALQYIDIFTLAFAFIALFVGSYIIVNTFRIIVTQRTREFGLLRAIGMSGRQVTTMILLEALVVAIVASTLGILTGWLLAVGLGALLELVSGPIFGPLVVPWTAVLWSYVLGTLVTLVSALAPAVHAARISPMEALREAGTQQRKPLKVRNIAGAALTLLGILGITAGLATTVDRPYIWVGAGAAVIITGVTLLSAQVLVPLAYALRGLLTKMFGIDGKLAANNIHREPRRSGNTAAALMIGVLLLALVATFTESVKSVVAQQLGGTDAALFLVSADGSKISPDAIAAAESVDGVAFASQLGIGAVQYDGADYSVAYFEPETVDQSFTYNSDPAFSQINGGVYIDPTVEELGVKVGDTVTLVTDEGSFDLTVDGEYLNKGDANFWVDWSTAEQMFGEEAGADQVLVVYDDGITADEDQARFDEVNDTVTAALAEYPTVLAFPPGLLQQVANQGIDFILGAITALLAAAILVAILGVMNTLLLSVTERTREIGLLRAVGLRRNEVWRMITLESVVMSLFGAIAGMVLGVSIGVAVVWSLGEFGFSTPTVPWIWLAVYAVGAFVAGIVAAIWPAWRASRMNVLEAIAADG